MGRGEPDNPDDHINHAADDRRFPNEGQIDLRIRRHYKPRRHEGQGLNEAEEPFALLDQRSHQRVELHDLSSRVQPSGQNQVDKPNRHQKQ